MIKWFVKNACLLSPRGSEISAVHGSCLRPIRSKPSAWLWKTRLILKFDVELQVPLFIQAQVLEGENLSPRQSEIKQNLAEV